VERCDHRLHALRSRRVIRAVFLMLDQRRRDHLVTDVEVRIVESFFDQSADNGFCCHFTISFSIKYRFIELSGTVTDMRGDVKRPYRSTRRSEQAAETRARVLDAAAEVFRQRGYERASIAAIAEAAGVADETVYGHFKNKRTLLGELMQRAVRGSDTRSVPDQAGPRALAAVTDQRRQLQLFAADIVRRLERAAPLVAVVGAGAQGEPELGMLLKQLHDDRLRNLRFLVDALRANGPLRTSPAAATETVWALTSPDVFQLLTGTGGWSQRRYTRWLAESLELLLLGPTAAR